MDELCQIQLPVWTIADDVQYGRTKSLPDSIPATASKDTGKFLPLFTTKKLAHQFIADSGLICKFPVELRSRKALHALAHELQKAGWPSVGIDVAIAPRVGTFCAIQVFIDALGSEKR